MNDLIYNTISSNLKLGEMIFSIQVRADQKALPDDILCKYSPEDNLIWINSSKTCRQAEALEYASWILRELRYAYQYAAIRHDKDLIYKEKEEVLTKWQQELAAKKELEESGLYATSIQTSSEIDAISFATYAMYVFYKIKMNVPFIIAPQIDKRMQELHQQLNLHKLKLQMEQHYSKK